MYGMSGPNTWMAPISGGRLRCRYETSTDERSGGSFDARFNVSRYWRKRAAGRLISAPVGPIGESGLQSLHPSSGVALRPLRDDHVAEPSRIEMSARPQDATERRSCASERYVPLSVGPAPSA